LCNFFGKRVESKQEENEEKDGDELTMMDLQTLPSVLNLKRC